MVKLSTRRREDVHGYISAVLRDELAEELARVPSKTRKASYECLTSVVTDLQTVVSSAVRDFCEQWAAAHVDPLMALPSELVAQCFAHLDLRGRIAVSHVSQAWRRFSLAERTLWNEYEVGRNVPTETAMRALEALLLRSDPAPFRLTYEHVHIHSYSDSDSDPGEAGARGDGILEIALKPVNMERMGSLTLPGAELSLADLFDPSLELHAPKLNRLECVAEWLAAIPAQWPARCAPRLEVLVLGTFSLPWHCEPFAVLRRLDAALPPEGFFPDVAFSEVFPNLRELELAGVVQRSLSMLAPLPQSIEVVRLYAGSQADAIDYSQFIQACPSSSSRIRHLQLSSAVHFSDALALFVRTSTGLWTVHVRNDRLCLEAAADGMEYEIECLGAISLAHEPRFADAHLERLGDLTLSLSSVVDLHPLGIRVLPALRSLALFIITDEDIEAGRALGDSPTQLSLPALESLKLLPGNDTDFTVWLAQDAPALLPRLLRGSPLPLATIRLRIVGMPRLSPEDRDRLLPFARRIIVQSASAPGMSELVFDSERARKNPEGTRAPWSG